MRVVLQRVTEASVDVDGRTVGRIGGGLLLLVGIEAGDTQQNVAVLAKKVIGFRVFEDNDGKMNVSVLDSGGQLLAVSQFTLCAETSKGRRPSFGPAADPETAALLFSTFVSALRESGATVATGEFGARMSVQLVNDGPVTFVLDG